MKQFIILILLFFTISACKTETNKKEISDKENQTINQINNIDFHDLEILEIDHCEYIFYKKNAGTNRGYGFMAHKGNCKNPVHYHNKKEPITNND